MENGDLDKILEITKENNKILCSMQRSARIDRFFKIIYWALILGSLFGTYYYIQPYIDQLLKLYNKVNSTSNSFDLPPEIFKRLDSLIKSK